MLHSLIPRILVYEGRRSVRGLLLLLMLLLLVRVGERVVVLEMRRHMMAECGHVHHGSSMEAICRTWEGERRSEAHSHPHPRGVEIASLIMIQRVCASGRWSIVSRRLVCKTTESERVRVEEGRCKPPWFVLGPGGRVEIFDIFVAEAVMPVLLMLVTTRGKKYKFHVSASSSIPPSLFSKHSRGRFAYLSGWGPPATASPSELPPELDPACVVAIPTSGKFWRKLAMKSSPGFCEDVLRDKLLASYFSGEVAKGAPA